MNAIKNAKYGTTIYNTKDIWVGKSIENYGEYSEHEVTLFQLIIQQNQTVIDVGANTGCHTLALSKFVGPTGKVLAYEPERHNFYTLCGNIAINSISNTFCYNQAVGNQNGKIKVPETSQININNYGGIELNTNTTDYPSYDVDIIRLDDLPPQPIHFIKADVEGMEIDVIQGATNLIQKTKPFLYLEFDRADKQLPLLNLLKELDYHCLLHTPPLYNQDNFYQNHMNIFLDSNQGLIGSQNIFCYHRSIQKPPCLSQLPEIKN